MDICLCTGKLIKIDNNAINICEKCKDCLRYQQHIDHVKSSVEHYDTYFTDPPMNNKLLCKCKL